MWETGAVLFESSNAKITIQIRWIRDETWTKPEIDDQIDEILY